VCGRYTLRARLNRILEEFACEVQAGLVVEPRFNIAPTQDVLIVQDGRLQTARWGLVPSWADDPKIGNRMINARSDGVADKPAFRRAFKKSRCLVVADGFYEWRPGADKKQPYFIRLRDDRPFAFAGLSESWGRGEETLRSTTIITTDANRLMAPLHDRMPVILPPEARPLWLDPEFDGRDALRALLKPYEADDLVAAPVGTRVNNPRNETPDCLAPP